MKAIHVRNVDPGTLASLKRLARSHNRSLQGELHAILERAARMAAPAGRSRQLRLITVNTGGKSRWRREEIYGSEGR